MIKKILLTIKEFLSVKEFPYQQASWAYIDGINEFMDKGTTPLGFHIIGIKEYFSSGSIYYTIGFMAFGFANVFLENPLFTQIKNRLGDEYLKYIMLLADTGKVFIPVIQTSRC